MDMDFTAVATPELETLLEKITAELATRRAAQAPVRVRISLGTASGGRTGWAKQLTGVDATQRGGYAFLGDFLREGLYDLPVGTLILDVFPNGSPRRPGKGAILWTADATAPDGLRKLAVTSDWPAESVVIRDAAVKALAL